MMIKTLTIVAAVLAISQATNLMCYECEDKTSCSADKEKVVSECGEGVNDCMVRFTMGEDQHVIKRKCNDGLTDLSDYKDVTGSGYKCKETKSNSHYDCYCSEDKCNDADAAPEPEASGSVRTNGAGVVVGLLVFFMARL